MIDRNTRRILATAFSAGAVHDFTLFMQSRIRLKAETLCLTDSGYQGIQKLHQRSQLPKKKSKHPPLTTEEKARNRALARIRIGVEHVIGRLKVFRQDSSGEFMSSTHAAS